MHVIGFHNPDEEYGAFSNWYPSKFVVDGICFTSMEQFMMYRKAVWFQDHEIAEQILATEDAARIKELGRMVAGYEDSIWSGIRQMVVYEGLIKKFSQNSELCEQLLNTGDAILAECAVKDRIWGIGLAMDDPKRLDPSMWRGQKSAWVRINDGAGSDQTSFRAVKDRKMGEKDGCLEQRKFGEVTTSYSGGTPTVGVKEYYDGQIPFIRSAEINSESTELFISERGLNGSSARLVSKGDILYALYGATSGEVGRARLEGAINQAILAIKPMDNYDVEYLSQWLRKSKRNIVETYLQGGQGNLSGAIVKELVVDFPSYNE